MCPPDEFGSALINLGDSRSNVERLADEVLRRDRRRIRTLSSLMIGAWLLAALLIPSVLLPMWAKIKHHSQTYTWIDGQRKSTDQLPPMEAMQGLAIVSTFIAAVSTSASLLATICTVWLVLTVRRSTLRQITVGLTDLSDQLRQLHPRPPAG